MLRIDDEATYGILGVVGGQVRLQPGMPVTPIPVDRPPQGGGAEAGPAGEPGESAEAVTPDSGH